MDNPQLTDGWKESRRGMITASRFGDVLAKPGTKRREQYIQELVWELMGVPDFDDDDKPWFRHGKEWEPEARSMYEWETGREVQLVGSIRHPSLPFVSCSPDGLIGDTGGLEIKCRTSLDAHLKVAEKGPDSAYRPQVQGSLWITGREFWDFTSYYKAPASGRRLITIYTVEPDPKMFERLEQACLDLWGEVQERLRKAA